ncbi:Crp/Fnr family transcriptional regulator [soil metagenome]
MDRLIADKLDKYFTSFKQQQYKKGEILIRADDNPQGIYYLKSGVVKKYAISKKGDELVVNLFKPISFFPMSWAINDSPNAYYYEAMTDLDIYRAPKEEVVKFIKSEPDVLYDLMSRVYKGTEGMLTKMTYLMAGNAYGRLITEIIIYAKRFGDKKIEQTTMKVSEKDLAAQSGMTRETVSREMKVLKDKKLVTFNKNILLIKNLDALESELTDGV